MTNSNPEAYFYQQKSLRERPKRCRKLPEDLPESLKFAHLNPKVAALLANKERQQKQDELNNLTNLDKHGVDIGNTFQHLKNQFDSVFVHDEDSQRFLFEEAKGSSCNILEQLSQLLWIFKDVLSPDIIPKSLEYQLMMSYKELTSDVIYLPRDWQTVAVREQFQKSSEIGSEDGHKNVVVDNEASRPEQSVMTDHPSAKKRGNKAKVHPGNEGDDVEVKHEKTTRRSDSKNSTMPSRHKQRIDRTGSATKKSPAPKRNVPVTSNHGADSPQEMKGGLPHINTSVIHFELSSKTCEEKGWIMNKGDEMQIERDQVLEWCIQILQKSLKTIATQKEKDVGQDKPALVRYYGDTRLETMLRYRRSPVKPEVNPAVYGGSPRIPKINDDKYEDKNLMLSGHSDGTSVVYYPSGRPAIVYSSASHGRPGFYTLVYDDDEDMKMLGCFTPTGTGSVYHPNGTVWFLATSIGGHLAGKDGHATRKWKWPTGNVKIPNIINLQLNKAINFRCAAFSQMSIVYNYEKESAKFLVSASAEVVEPISEENDQLLTTFNFTSNAAKELLRLSYSKLKMKKKKDKVNGESDPDIPKILEIPEVTMYGTDAEKDYARLLRKGKGLVEDWMDTYRTSFGLSSPCLDGIQDVPKSRKRYSQSAKPSRFDSESRGATLGMGNKLPYMSARIPSAPAGQIRKTSAYSSKAGAGSVKFDDDSGDSQGCGDGRKMSLSLTSLSAAVADVTKLLSLSTSPRSRTHSARPKTPVKEPIDEATVIYNCETCPVVLCQRLMRMANVNCRCSRYIIPNITDIEFDLFISKVVPNAQLQVIIVVSSLFPKRNEVFELLEQMYIKQNRNRLKPCQQCYCDTFRLLKYNINTAAEHSDHTQPLLLTRHNAVPGMILIYSDGNLLFCDNIFNGYGNTKKDFKKQITKSRLDAVHGVFLPKDFRFKPSQGHHGPRSAWGGEIGGAGVDSYGSPGTSKDDVILHRPSSSSTLDGQVPDKLRGLDASNFICLSLSPMGYRPKSHIVRTRHKLPTAVK